MRVSEYTVASLAQFYKALGDETRLRIVHLLAHRGELCVCDVESILDISQSKASRHLTYLRHAGIVEDRRDGTWVYYRVVNGDPTLGGAVRELKKALREDAQAQHDLAAAEKSCRTSSCAGPALNAPLRSTNNRPGRRA